MLGVEYLTLLKNMLLYDISLAPELLRTQGLWFRIANKILY